MGETSRRRRAARALGLAAAVVAAFALGRVTGGGPSEPLEPWHRLAPDGELAASLGDRPGADLAAYRALEARLFANLEELLREEVTPSPALAASRFLPGGFNNPATFPVNWNRTFELEPAEPAGSALLLHGLTDSPYSMRSIGELLRSRGLRVVGLRLPGHGTVPAALAEVGRREWAAAVRIAARDVAAGRPPGSPFLVVGYSNGAALALSYALDALDDPRLPRPDGLVLLSPEVGLTRFAALSGWSQLQRLLPFAGRLRWHEVAAEIEPFKFASFPYNAGWQAHRLTVSNRARVARLSRQGRAGELPPMLAFASLADATVRMEAVASDLFERVGDARDELVVFDVNRYSTTASFLASDPAGKLAWLVKRAPLEWRISVLTNRDPTRREVEERSWAPAAGDPRVTPLPLAWPPGVYSLSHVAVPFPADDPIYGAEPRPGPSWGLPLGTLELRGERGLLRIPVDSLIRLRFNPFFPYLEGKVVGFVDTLVGRPPAAGSPPGGAAGETGSPQPEVAPGAPGEIETDPS